MLVIKLGKECTEPGGIKSIIQHSLFLLKYKDDVSFKSLSIDFSEDGKEQENKISKNDFFKIFNL